MTEGDRVDIGKLLINEECGVYCPDDRFAYKVHRVNIAELDIHVTIIIH
jgi:hypothetical protein